MVAKVERNEGMARKLFPYDRESFGTQAAGTSQQRQKEMIAAIAAEKKAVVDDSYALSDTGVSGFHGRNIKKKLGLFIRLCKEGVVRKGDILCIERVNRLSRMVWTEQVKLWEEILSYGVEIVTCEPRFDITQKNIGQLEMGCPLAILMMLGYEESKQKSDWVKYSHKVARKQAIETGKPHGKKPPSWIRPVGVPHPFNPKRRITTGWELIPERVEVIRQLHRWAWDGYGTPTILKLALENKLLCWGRGGKWTKIMVRQLLTSRALIGFCEPNGRNYKCDLGKPNGYLNYPPVLTDEEYERTKHALRSRRKSGGPRQGCRFNLFRNLARTKDGRPLELASSTGADGVRHYYLAPDRQTLRVPYEEFERVVLSCLRRITARDIDGSLHSEEAANQTLLLTQELAGMRETLAEYERQVEALGNKKPPTKIVETMAKLEEAIPLKKDELDTHKLKSNTSGRTEALADTQGILDYLDHEEDPAKRQASLERLKVRLSILLEHITVEVTNRRGLSKVVHLRIEYKGPHIDCYHFPIGNPDWPYEAAFDEEDKTHYQHNRCLCHYCRYLEPPPSWR